MRTTLNLDEDVLHAARSIARVERRRVGPVISELARRGLLPSEQRIDTDQGFPVFRPPAGAGAITEEMVRGALEDH